MAKTEADDHAMFELVPCATMKTGKTVKVTTPSDVLRIFNKEELQAQLDHYSHRPIKLTLPDSKFARKWFVEKVRPALRYYCKKFGVAVPSWLQDDTQYTELPAHEKMDLFGTDEIKPREFKQLPQKSGSVTRNA